MCRLQLVEGFCSEELTINQCTIGIKIPLGKLARQGIFPEKIETISSLNGSMCLPTTAWIGLIHWHSIQGD